MPSFCGFMPFLEEANCGDIFAIFMLRYKCVSVLLRMLGWQFECKLDFYESYYFPALYLCTEEQSREIVRETQWPAQHTTLFSTLHCLSALLLHHIATSSQILFINVKLKYRTHSFLIIAGKSLTHWKIVWHSFVGHLFDHFHSSWHDQYCECG